MKNTFLKLYNKIYIKRYNENSLNTHFKHLPTFAIVFKFS